MLTPTCNDADLSVSSDGLVHCANWIFMPVSGWDFTNTEFQELLSALFKLGFAAVFVWWVIWALRRL